MGSSENITEQNLAAKKRLKMNVLATKHKELSKSYQTE